MANVLIRNMEIPKTCARCIEMGIPVRCRVKETEAVTAVMSNCNRPDDCPLIELPENYGRLKDVDKLIEVFSAYSEVFRIYDAEICEGVWAVATRTIDEFPTVIPASEGEK